MVEKPAWLIAAFVTLISAYVPVRAFNDPVGGIRACALTAHDRYTRTSANENARAYAAAVLRKIAAHAPEFSWSTTVDFRLREMGCPLWVRMDLAIRSDHKTSSVSLQEAVRAADMNVPFIVGRVSIVFGKTIWTPIQLEAMVHEHLLDPEQTDGIIVVQRVTEDVACTIPLLKYRGTISRDTDAARCFELSGR